MRDGVRLSANVFLPATTPAAVPPFWCARPTARDGTSGPNYRAFVDHGYAVVMQDVRGRYESEGVFDPLEQEVADGDDTLNWIARQTWSDGRSA